MIFSAFLVVVLIFLGVNNGVRLTLVILVDEMVRFVVAVEVLSGISMMLMMLSDL